jgi:phosphohistidine phosphatase SixA
MLLGHNPGWAALHHYFTGHTHDYPTGACTVLARTDHDSGDWLDPASWRFVDLILPRELEA